MVSNHNAFLEICHLIQNKGIKHHTKKISQQLMFNYSSIP